MKSNLKAWSLALVLRALFIGIGVSFLGLHAHPAEAAPPELRLSPLKYEASLELGRSKVGYVQIDNPTGTSVSASLEVQGFRQINNDGSLEYFDDERLSAGIIPGVREVQIGPRESVRVKFTVNPNVLGPGGAYGVLFVRAKSGELAASQINTSARVGTLIILDVAGSGTRAGAIRDVQIPSLSWGAADLPLRFSFSNTGSGGGALAFAPKFEISGAGGSLKSTGPFVFPGRTRSVDARLKLGSHFGPATLTIRDTVTGQEVKRQIWVVSGIWRWVIPLFLVGIVIAGLLGLVIRRSGWSPKLQRKRARVHIPPRQHSSRASSALDDIAAVIANGAAVVSGLFRRLGDAARQAFDRPAPWPGLSSRTGVTPRRKSAPRARRRGSATRSKPNSTKG